MSAVLRIPKVEVDIHDQRLSSIALPFEPLPTPSMSLTIHADPASPPTNVKLVHQWTCVICDITCTPQCKAGHEAGKKHTKKLQQVKLGVLRSTHASDGWQCRLCEMNVSPGGIDSHLDGTAHEAKAISRVPGVNGTPVMG